MGTAASAETTCPDNRQAQPSRRDFIRRSAALTASLSVLPAGAVRGAAANSRIEVGIVGQGGRGGLIADIIADKHKGLQLVALADYFPDVVQAAGERLKVDAKRCFHGLDGYRRLLASKVDAVLLETPPCFFPDHASAAVEAGVHVYMAKPVAVDVPGCRGIAEMGKLAAQKSRVFLVDFQVPTEDLNIEVVRRCKDGLIGPLGLLSSFYCDESFPDPARSATIEDRLRGLVWVNDTEIGGDYLVNAGIHAVDAALWLAGAVPVSASGATRIVRPDPHGNSPDIVSVTYRFADGLIMNHQGEHLRNTHGFACSCTAYGRDGYAMVNYEGSAFVRGNKGGFRGGDVTNLYVNGISRNLDKFEACIRQGRFENETVASGVNSTLTTILGREAARKNTVLTWEQLMQEDLRIEPDLTGLKV